MGQSYPISSISPERFREIENRFIELGRHLSDDQMLRLADRYHDMIRTRHCIQTAQKRRTGLNDPEAAQASQGGGR